MALATFGAGCFWGIEDAFRRIDGVIDAVSGYSGGATSNPSYEDVCTGTTGHTEVVQVEFDPDKVSYEKLLDVFWDIHDPTTLNRQGPDIGTQYRSAVYYHSPEQNQAAVESLSQKQSGGAFKNPIVTEITEASEFYQAEEYHQRYFERRGGQH
ncbi:MAG: peptide-methionine (S)-S-oxide reductase MsrA [Rhodospirillales bacterium]|nr:peptide-methionine (S)-S-oxide reductase MsrA [Rhodospirillales bacterium]